MITVLNRSFMAAFSWGGSGNRITFALLSLLALLQRAPLLRTLVQSGDSLGALAPAHILRSTIGMAAVLGAVDTLVGATRFVQTPSGVVKGTVGTPLSVGFSYTGTPTVPASFKVIGSLPPGLAIAGLANGIVNEQTPLVSGTPTQAGDFSFKVQGFNALNATGHTDGIERTISFTISASSDGGGGGTLPSITLQPSGASLPAGRTFALAVSASATTAITYQWYKGGVAIAGATSDVFLIDSITASDAGSYTVKVTNAAGTVESSPAVLTLAPTANVRLSNQSVLTKLEAGGVLTMGFVVEGSTAQTVLVRVGGPALAALGVADTMSDTKLKVFKGQTQIAENDNWAASLSTVFSKLGAFGFPASSKDSAIVITLDPGAYTAQALGAGAQLSGVVIVEVYALK